MTKKNVNKSAQQNFDRRLIEVLTENQSTNEATNQQTNQPKRAPKRTRATQNENEPPEPEPETIPPTTKKPRGKPRRKPKVTNANAIPNGTTTTGDNSSTISLPISSVSLSNSNAPTTSGTVGNGNVETDDSTGASGRSEASIASTTTLNAHNSTSGHHHCSFDTSNRTPAAPGEDLMGSLASNVVSSLSGVAANIGTVGGGVSSNQTTRQRPLSVVEMRKFLEQHKVNITGASSNARNSSQTNERHNEQFSQPINRQIDNHNTPRIDDQQAGQIDDQQVAQIDDHQAAPISAPNNDQNSQTNVELARLQEAIQAYQPNETNGINVANVLQTVLQTQNQIQNDLNRV